MEAMNKIQINIIVGTTHQLPTTGMFLPTRIPNSNLETKLLNQSSATNPTQTFELQMKEEVNLDRVQIVTDLKPAK